MTIRLKLALLISGTLIVILSFLTIIYYHKISELMLKEVYSHLESISETKMNLVKHLTQKRYELLVLASSNSDLVNTFLYQRRLQDSVKAMETMSRYSNSIESFENIMLVSASGNTFLSNNKQKVGFNFSKYKCFRSAISGKKYWGDFHITDEGLLFTYMSCPVIVRGKVVGAIIIETDGSDVLSLTNDYTGLGNTGETVIGMRDNQTILVNSLRFNEKGPLAIKITPDKVSLPMNRALNKENGIINKEIDYRGTEVIASIRFLQENEWGMVTKIDISEAYLPINKILSFLLLINLVAVITTFILSYFGSSYIVKPLDKLLLVVNKMKYGDLSERAEIKSKGEIGILATSFNEMASKLEKKVEDLNNFAHIVSHDLKGPLNAAALAIHLIKKKYQHIPFDSKGYELLDIVSVKLKDMEEMINDILRKAKQETVKKQLVDTKTIVYDLLNEIAIPQHIKMEIQENLPTIQYHPISFRQVIQNLVGNSVKYMNKASGLIKIKCKKEGRFYIISVYDNGQGISKDKIKYVFDMFQIAHNNTNIESTGIGLNIVKKIVEENGGRVWIKSKPGIETEVFFTVPL